MSSFYVLKEQGVNIDSKASITLLNEEIEKLKTYTNEENKKLVPLDGSRALTSDLDCRSNALIGVDDINANNSVPSKGFVRGELAKKLNLTGGTLKALFHSSHKPTRSSLRVFASNEKELTVLVFS